MQPTGDSRKEFWTFLIKKICLCINCFGQKLCCIKNRSFPFSVQGEQRESWGENNMKSALKQKCTTLGYSNLWLRFFFLSTSMDKKLFKMTTEKKIWRTELTFLQKKPRTKWLQACVTQQWSQGRERTNTKDRETVERFSVGRQHRQKQPEWGREALCTHPTERNAAHPQTTGLFLGSCSLTSLLQFCSRPA